MRRIRHVEALKKESGRLVKMPNTLYSFGGAIEYLESSTGVQVKVVCPPGMTISQIKLWEQKNGVLPNDLSDFYRDMNGCQINWRYMEH